jgi:lipopolysaccharide export LptBFGC system permease protein LptF
MSGRLAGYVLRHAIGWALVCGAMVVAVAVALDGLERASILVGRQIGATDAARYLGLRLGTVAHLLAPLAAGLAAALAVSTLRHRGEWDGMRALGAGHRSLRMPFALLGVVATAVLVLYEGYGLPAAIEGAARVEATAVLGGEVRLGEGAGPRWWVLPDGVLIAREVDPAGDRLRGVTWLRRGDDGVFERRVDADQLVAGADGWEAEGATIRELMSADPDDPVRVVERVPLELPGLTPGGIRRRLLPLAQHDLSALWADPRPPARFTLHARLAHPLTVGLSWLWVALLAAVLPRGRALAAGAGVGVALAATLLGMLGGALAPALGWPVWLPWSLPALLTATCYWTWKYDPSLLNQPLVQSA